VSSAARALTVNSYVILGVIVLGFSFGVRMIVNTYHRAQILQEVAEDLAMVIELCNRTGVSCPYSLPDLGFNYTVSFSGDTLNITANTSWVWEGGLVPRLEPGSIVLRLGVPVIGGATFHPGDRFEITPVGGAVVLREVEAVGGEP